MLKRVYPITYKELRCQKMKGGKKPLWHARTQWAFGEGSNIIGAGNTADNAIKDFQKKYRKMLRDK